MKNERIVITGLGIVSSIGTGKDAFWNALTKGESGISKITSFDTSDYPTHNGGEVKNFHHDKNSGRTSELAISAARLAITDSTLTLDKFDQNRIGLCLGTTMAETQLFEKANRAWIEGGKDCVDAKWISFLPANAIALNVAARLNLKGPNYAIPTACAAGNYAIGYAYDLLRMGEADLMLAGGADAFSRIAFTGFNRLLAIAPDKCQPFDKNRKGMMVGEGAAMVVLEKLESALTRKANIYAEILGYGLSCDASHMTAPHPEGIAQALENTLKESRVSIDGVDYISAHGTGTPSNDKAECAAIKKVFGEYSKKIPISSIKSMLGHTMGAASAIEAVACCLAVKNDLIPPTINFQTPDPECDIDCVPNTARKIKVNIALNNAFAFGGNNSCLALKKFTPE